MTLPDNQRCYPAACTPAQAAIASPSLCLSLLPPPRRLQASWPAAVKKDRQWLDTYRRDALQKRNIVQQVNARSPYDPAAALWVLRVTAYRHATSTRPSVAQVQANISEGVAVLQRNWFSLAGRLKNDADAYQVCMRVPVLLRHAKRHAARKCN